MATPSVDLAVQGGIVVTASEATRADVLINGEKVYDVVAGGTQYEARRVIDASGQYVLPGIVDAHQHPVYADRIDTMSKQAAAGGTTTIVAFVGALKAWGSQGTLVDAVESFIDEGEEHSHVDFSVHGSLSSDDIDTLDEQVPRLVERGVTSYKGFMAYKRRGMKLEDEQFLQAMEIVAANGALLQVHAENGALVDHLTDTFRAQGKVSPEYWAKASPPLAETESVLRIATLASTVGCPVYLVHLSSRETMDVLALWRRWNGQRIYTETCPQYLTLSRDALVEKGSLAKGSPPLREQTHSDALWEAIASGGIDVVGTDSGGYTKEQKQPHFGDIFEPPPSLPGLCNLVEVMHHYGVNSGRITLPKLVEILCEKPARIFGMYPDKGVLQPGSDADVVVFDPGREHTITAAEQYLNTDYHLWEGVTCVGYPTHVLQRGRVIARDGQLTGAEPHGRFVARRRHGESVE